MPTPDEATVRRVLTKRDRGLRLRTAVAEAWGTFTTTYPDRAWWRRKSTRAGLVWEHAVNNTIAAFAADDGARPIPHHDTMSFVFDDLVLVRIKKASIELITSNVQTILASLFHDHREDLFGFTGHHRVETAYVLNRLETQMDWIGVVARQKRKKLFDFDLNELATPAETLPFPQRTGRTAADVAKLKKPAEPAEGEGSES